MTEIYDLPLSSGVIISTLFDKPTLFNNISKTFINFMFFACLNSCWTNTKNSAHDRRSANNSRSSDKGSLSKDDDDDGSEDAKCNRFRLRLQGCGQIFKRTNFLTCANSLHRTMQTLSQILGLFADKKNLHDSAGPVKTKGGFVQVCLRLANNNFARTSRFFVHFWPSLHD